MIEIAIGLAGFACGFVTSAVFAAQASRNAAEREAGLQAKVEASEEGERVYQKAYAAVSVDLKDALERERKLREVEAKRITHLRSIASSGGKAKAAKRKA